MIAGIYTPEVGRVTTEGRIAPLFDPGFGMDPDSTGFDNIYIRGLYLGMTKAEIETRVEDIIEFTELGEFLNMPMRTYSMGMQARLSFAVSTTISRKSCCSTNRLPLAMPRSSRRQTAACTASSSAPVS